ncbi:MAG: hypothetical protein ACYDAP_09905, partial [Thermoplasmataceae archaeon]
MLTINFGNLIYFVPQYVASSALAVIIFILLQNRFRTHRLWFKTVSRRKKDLTNWRFLFCSDINANKDYYPSIHIDHFSSSPNPIYGNTMSTLFFKNSDEKIHQVFDLTLLRGIRSYFAPVSCLHKNEIYDNHIIYSILVSIYAISVWIGVLLVLTPYNRMEIFIPHFSSSINLLFAIVLGISIFEATISIIVFFTGNSRKWFLYIESLVFMVASLFFISPSMSWIYGFSVASRILIYVLIIGLILFITFLIFQLESRKNSFLAALYSSGIAYGFFIATVAYNIYIIIITK